LAFVDNADLSCELIFLESHPSRQDARIVARSGGRDDYALALLALLAELTG
jgi:hypothetical protein